MFKNRKKVDVGGVNREERSVTGQRDRKGPNDAKPIGCGEKKLENPSG